MALRLVSSLLALASASAACTTVGPTANVSLVPAEVQDTTAVDNVAVASVIGLVPEAGVAQGVTAISVRAYGERARPAGALAALIERVPELPAGLGDLLLVGYQSEFVRVTRQFAVDGKKPEMLELPAAKLTAKVPPGLSGVRQLAPKLAQAAPAIREAAAAVRAGDERALAALASRSDNFLPLVQQLASVVLAELDVTYVLLVQVAGDEAAWNAGQEVRLMVGLANVKTGKLRYFASVNAKRGAAPVPYVAQIGAMSHSLFETVRERDPLPAAFREALLKKAAAAEQR